MRIFHWEVKVGYDYVADGYLLAENREEAKQKLQLVPFYDKHEKIELDDCDCGFDGCEIDKNGIAVRWED